MDPTPAVASSLGGTELWLLPVMVVFYVVIPLALFVAVTRGRDDAAPAETDETEGSQRA
ncbi:hypothetical protein [Natrialbaceae archaeon AArc-T1-2]|uniref:hypothetical protein n=1 Tax=Natrialbaceae archaeon AArc-T1-2 TaxID=3053904 RepID=UPI00255AD81B|nr:hypothetical protein [Natrialbaceae archaeon AArc-T1-2]WIV66047.1 hypothetical protein QQ977_10100 [Natrialbaceae archaeon AArc-T1-2]